LPYLDTLCNAFAYSLSYLYTSYDYIPTDLSADYNFNVACYCYDTALVTKPKKLLSVLKAYLTTDTVAAMLTIVVFKLLTLDYACYVSTYTYTPVA
jgi:hypothetical protein